MRNPVSVLRLWWQLVRWRPEILIYLAAARGERSARRDRLFFRLCGILRQVGVPDTESCQENLMLAEDFYESEAARLARLIAPLGEANLDEPANWSLHLGPKEQFRADQVLWKMSGRSLLAVSLGTKRQSSDWTLPNWQGLMTRLAAALPGYGLVLTGVATEQSASEAVAQAWRGVDSGVALNLCGELTPRESAAVFTRARVFLGHDSGPMHLAAAVGTPCVAIFSARNRRGIWFPHGRQHRIIHHQVSCSGCGLDTCVVEQKKCLLSISVAEVETQVLSLLSSLPSAPLLRTAQDSVPDRYTSSSADTL